MNDTDLKTAVLSAIQALPKPLTVDAVLACAKATLEAQSAGKQSAQFETWLQRNGEWLVAKYA